MLDVVNEQLLVLHFMLQTKPHEQQDSFGVGQSIKRLQKREHLFVNVIPVSDGLSHGWTRLCSSLRTLYSFAESLVIRVEVKKVILRINAIIRSVSPQHGFKEPGGMTDMP